MIARHFLLSVVAILAAHSSSAGAQLALEANETPASTKSRQLFEAGQAAVAPSTPSPVTKGDTDLDREIADLRRKALHANPDSSSLVRLGDRLMQKSRESAEAGLYAEAESAYKKALAINPNFEDAMVGVAWVRNSQHEFDDGRSWIEKALAINPRLPHAHALLGDAAVELGNYDDAFEHYQTALARSTQAAQFFEGLESRLNPDAPKRVRTNFRRRLRSG
jgi:tetratricopeptide (TPR) repeat protein